MFRMKPVRQAMLMFIVVFAGCLVGICSRPVGFLASVWPANALMLVVLLHSERRMPVASHVALWSGGILAFMAADLLTGATVLKAAFLNGANLVSIAVAYGILCRQRSAVLRLQQPTALLSVVLAAVCAGAVAGVVGGVANQVLFQRSAADGFAFWWVAEIVNYVAILPVLLSAMALPGLQQPLRWQQVQSCLWPTRDWLPACSVLLCFAMAFLIGGPGVIAFPLLALLWCALVYPVFIITVLTLLYSVLLLTLISQIYPDSLAETELISVRLGIAINALAPVLLSIVTQNRNALLAKLRHLSLFDSLTGVASRASFAEDARQQLDHNEQPGAILLLDLDHFKQVNDSFGHAAGDQVLRQAAHRMKHVLRENDLIGRWGGEEFVVLLPCIDEVLAMQLAERIKTAISSQPIGLSTGLSVAITVSIGVCIYPAQTNRTLDELLALADGALYRCKAAGRNCVQLAS